MHSYLRAVGFASIRNNAQLKEVIGRLIEKPTNVEITYDSEGNELVELDAAFSDAFGVKAVGRYEEDGKFVMDYYYPYFKGTGITTHEMVEVQKHAEKDSYAGICDEVRLGVTLIFYLQNMCDYLNEKKISDMPRRDITVTLSGLSIQGKVILPICKNQKHSRETEKQWQDRSHLIAAAREGDEDAIESLTLEDIDTYSMLSKRVIHEDILTIVNSYFMPYGIECDQYSILGDILDVDKITNTYTQEEMYRLKVECNNMIFDVCMNEKDLLGEPAIGRRFKGIIWMQGRLNYI